MSDLLEKIVSLSKQRGLIFQSSEIYGGMAAIYDYGPLGVELKRNVRERWWQAMVYQNDDIVGQDAAVMMHPDVWKASGHLDAFNDPMIDDKTSGHRYRADELIEEHAEKLRSKGKEEEAAQVEARLAEALQSDDANEAFYQIIQDEQIRGPDSGQFDWTKVRNFNLMFESNYGPTSDEKVYLRPETAQGIFVNFRNVQETARQHLPFGIAQIGKAFRNEIVARQFIFRTREFEQMEMQYFVKPGEEDEAFARWKEERMQWHVDNGIRPEHLRWHVHDQLSHYAKAAEDIEYRYPMGWKELEGIHSRTDFDLSQHEAHSGKKMSYYDPWEQERYTPFVVETSVGLDRTILMLLCDAYTEDEVDGEERTVLKLHPELAPIRAAVFPLVKKEGMPEKAHEIERDLRSHFNVMYDERGSMGKRYRRMDEAGTPFCITIDGQTMDDGTVTVRDRDTTEQDRVPAENVASYLLDHSRGWAPDA